MLRTLALPRLPLLSSPRRLARAAAVPVAAIAVAAVLTPAAPASADIGQQIASVQSQLDQLNADAERAAERFNEGRIRLADAQRAATTAQSRLARADQRLRALRDQVGEFAAQAYRSGGTLGDVSAIASADGPESLVYRATTLNAISRSQSDTLNGLAVARHDRDSASVAATAAVDQQKKIVAGLEDAKRTVAAKSEQAQQLLRQLQAKQAELIRQAKARAARLAAERALAAARARAAAMAAAARAFAAQQAAAPAAPSVPAPAVHYSGSAAQIAVRAAESKLGRPYVWGAAGPSTFDCSGLTMWAYAQAGIYLPHYTGAQWNVGRHVSRSELRPGDLVFFHSDLHHMGMYVGNNTFIHAPHTGDVVKYSSLSGYYAANYAGAVRVAG